MVFDGFVFSSCGQSLLPSECCLSEGRLYEQGYTIGGARLQLSDNHPKDDPRNSKQVIRELRMELEEVALLLAR